MNRFRFRLESLLRFRGAKEEEKKREFGVVLGHVKHEDALYNNILGNVEKHDRLIEESGQGKISVRTLIHNFFYARSLDKKKFEQKKSVKKAEVIVEEKRLELVEATKKKKILEILKENKLDEHNKAVIKEEQTLIDEISSQSYNHQDKR